MSEFVSNPLFGIALSILAYLVGMLIYRRFPHPLTTPLLLSAIFIIIFLKATGISYQDYYQGGVYLNNLIVPSTVALGLSLIHIFLNVLLGRLFMPIYCPAMVLRNHFITSSCLLLSGLPC